MSPKKKTSQLFNLLFKMAAAIGGKDLSIKTSLPHSYFGHRLMLSYTYTTHSKPPIKSIEKVREEIIDSLINRGYKKEESFNLYSKEESGLFCYVEVGYITQKYFPEDLFWVGVSCYRVRQRYNFI